jgi:hypothetical protein
MIADLKQQMVDNEAKRQREEEERDVERGRNRIRKRAYRLGESIENEPSRKRFNEMINDILPLVKTRDDVNRQLSKLESQITVSAATKQNGVELPSGQRTVDPIEYDAYMRQKAAIGQPPATGSGHGEPTTTPVNTNVEVLEEIQDPNVRDRRIRELIAPHVFRTNAPDRQADVEHYKGQTAPALPHFKYSTLEGSVTSNLDLICQTDPTHPISMRHRNPTMFATLGTHMAAGNPDDANRQRALMSSGPNASIKWCGPTNEDQKKMWFAEQQKLEAGGR